MFKYRYFSQNSDLWWQLEHKHLFLLDHTQMSDRGRNFYKVSKYSKTEWEELLESQISQANKQVYKQVLTETWSLSQGQKPRSNQLNTS